MVDGDTGIGNTSCAYLRYPIGYSLGLIRDANPMVDINAEYAPRKAPAKGVAHGPHGILFSCYFNQDLFADIQAEAISRGWPVGRMIRHLCEASIEGIE